MAELQFEVVGEAVPGFKSECGPHIPVYPDF